MKSRAGAGAEAVNTRGTASRLTPLAMATVLPPQLQRQPHLNLLAVPPEKFGGLTYFFGPLTRGIP
jgi:hypothetical protein